ncbi:Icc-related predicted phosphoesterase [Bradyrhizobium sp. AZCC 1577]
MRVQIMSDLHVDFPGARGIPPCAAGADLVVVAGDTCQGLVNAIEACRRAFPNVDVAMVAGNHEYYGYTLRDELEAGRVRARQLGVHLLESSIAYFGSKLLVVGATLWTDYGLFGETLRIPAMRTAADVMRDHKRIKWQRNPWMRFRPEEARALHLQSRAFIETELAKAQDGVRKVMVLTHHAASIEAVNPQFQRSIVSAAYASELLPIIDRYQPAWWVSGHTHHSMSFLRGRTRLLSNPRGYADENPVFDPSYTIEVDND